MVLSLSADCIQLIFPHVHSFKQMEDDEKSVERARRELVKLDEQMGVSLAQFTKVARDV